MTITYEQVLSELETIVSEQPDFVYRRVNTEADPYDSDCWYVHSVDGKLVPGCIIGHWLIRFHKVDPGNLHDNFEALYAGYVVPKLVPDITTAAVELLIRVQHNQDCGRTWRESLNRATARS